MHFIYFVNAKLIYPLKIFCVKNKLTCNAYLTVKFQTLAECYYAYIKHFLLRILTLTIEFYSSLQMII